MSSENEAPREPLDWKAFVPWELVELDRLDDAAEHEAAMSFRGVLTREMVAAMRGWGASEDEIDAAAARADCVHSEGWAWLMVQEKPLWRDALRWVAGVEAECPLPKWAV